MKTNTSQRIIEIIKQKKQVKPKELPESLAISERAVFKQLRKLLEKGVLEKTGIPPRVYYYLKQEKGKEKVFLKIKSQIIENFFLIITPAGQRLSGLTGFKYWCDKHRLSVKKTAKEYESAYKKYAKYKKSGLIDGMYKLRSTFNDVYINRLYYLEFYSIERFGKTKLGWLLLYAKQSQSKLLIKELVEEIRGGIQKIIRRYHIDAIGFIPPTVKRDIQLMAELEKNLNFSLPLIKFQKIKMPIVVPQKTLNRLEDRIENAEKSIFLNDNRIFKNILLIDDAVGSGATINEVAKKIREKKLVKNKIIGLAITGSFKGFEVISEV